MKDMPGRGRVSYSAHAWDSGDSQFVVIFGGGNVRDFVMMNDLLLFDVKANEWHALKLPKGSRIKPRCRHSSTWK